MKTFILGLSMFVAVVAMTPTDAQAYGGSGTVIYGAGWWNNLFGQNDSQNNDSGEVLGAETYSFAVDLQYGDRGEDVVELHKVLIAAGYLNIEAPTGWFGPMTFAAVKLYQAAHGVPATGFVGPLTRAELNK